jgi:hypothetical protein
MYYWHVLLAYHVCDAPAHIVGSRQPCAMPHLFDSHETSVTVSCFIGLLPGVRGSQTSVGSGRISHV